MLQKLERLPKLFAGLRSPVILGTIALLAVGGGGIFYMRQQQAAAQQAAKERSIAASKWVPTTVTALGKLAPKGEVIKLSAPTSAEGVKIDKM
ncbi:MAG: hypothetical protein KME54_15950 [Tolypothrix brevis GSE-NOS-MK-07-07A]|jgi:HlyD family secretion protein|nr:hypothetical protein [Tolypothrix brevis GSE-NOS-MK-07-07A]